MHKNKLYNSPFSISRIAYSNSVSIHNRIVQIDSMSFLIDFFVGEFYTNYICNLIADKQK